MNVEIGYDLPFVVRAVAVPAGAAARVVVETMDPPTDENFRQIEGHLQLWIECAMFGAGGGPRVKPSFYRGPLDVTQVLVAQDRVPGPNAITIEAPAIVVEPAYAVILLHKLLCLAHEFVPLKAVTITLPTATAAPHPIDVVRAAQSQFPERAPLSFQWDEDSDTGADSLTLTIRFTRALTEDEGELLIKALWSWLAQGAQGGYISPPYQPDRFALIASEDPEVAGDEVTWNLDDVDVDVRAFNLLANLLQAYSDRFVPIVEVIVA